MGIVGGGVVGLELGIMLARDGNDVLQLERDPESPPDSVDAAWERWERRGVAQRWAAELSGWAWRTNPLLEAPEPFHGGARPDDGRYEMVTGRRVFVEKVVAELA